MERPILVEMVKVAQKRGMVGSKGGWQEFLNFHDKKFGASLSDPAKRSPDVLQAFLDTFTKEEDAMFFEKLKQTYSNRELVEQLKQKSREKESAELRLVRMTLEHPRYVKDYSFPSHKEEWAITKLSKSKQKRSTEMVAIDCEMVLCEDGSEALVRVCVVDHNLQVKLNELVKPNKAVADYRTEITGITENDLKGVTCSLVDIQKFMKRLLLRGTILVGHSLNNDLQALKIDHVKVIDTSFIFRYSDQSVYRRPSLNNLCKAVLGSEVRKNGASHNCLDDASAAMKLVRAKLDHQFDKGITLVNDDEPDTGTEKLLLHGIPVTVACEELHKLFHGNFTIEEKTNKKARGGKYSVLAIFKSPEEAHQAYEDVGGESGKDSYGRPQKFVSFQLSTGETVGLYIRMMVQDHSNCHVSSTKRMPEVEKASDVVKKLKTDEKIEEPMEMKPNSTSCIEHMKEIEKLNKLIRERDEEISALHKIVASLARGSLGMTVAPE